MAIATVKFYRNIELYNIVYIIIITIAYNIVISVVGQTLSPFPAAGLNTPYTTYAGPPADLASPPRPSPMSILRQTVVSSVSCSSVVCACVIAFSGR